MQEYVESLIKKGLITEDSEEFLIELFNSYLVSYDYYGLKKESWIRLFDKALNMALKTDNFDYYITVSINKEVFNYFKKYYKNDDVRLLNNFLIKLKKTSRNYWEILKNLYKELYVRYIMLDESLVQKLRDNSPVFKTLIKNLGIDNLSNTEIIKLCMGKYDTFIALKPQELGLKETINIFREIAKYINYDENHLMRDIDNKEKIIEKIRFLIKNQYIIKKIEKIFESINIRVIEESLKSVLYNFSLEELKKLKDDLKVYENTSFKDLSFVYRLLPLVNYYNKKEEKNKEKVKKTVKKEKEFPIEENKNNIYNYFPDNTQVTLEKKKEIVDYLMLLLNPKERKLANFLVKDELNNQRDIDLIKVKIMNLVNIYNIWLEKGILPEVVKEAFYDYFLSKDNITKVDKEQIIEILIRNYSIDIQGLIRRYYLKDTSLSTEEISIALEKINTLKEQYNRLLEVDLSVGKDSTIYDIIPDNDRMAFQDRKIIERFLSSFNSYQRVAMERYIKGEYLEERDKARARKDWNLVLAHYRAWLSKGVIKDIKLFKNVKVKEIIEFLNNKRLKREWYNLSREKKEVYEDMFNVIEYQYYLRKVSKIQYRVLMFNKLNEFIDVNPKINIEELFRNYKEEMYIEMRLEEKR